MRRMRGSVLVFTLLFLSIISVLAMQLARNAATHSSFGTEVVARGQATFLALSGIEVARHQLSARSNKKLLETILPHLNRWQMFRFTRARDGVDGTMRISISSEDGKINIGELFDFKKGVFKESVRPFLENIVIKGSRSFARGEFASRIEALIKKRGRRIDDLSELLRIDDMRTLPFFYEPPESVVWGESVVENTLALSDLFTVWGGTATMHPLLFSDALCALVGIRRPQARDSENRSESFKHVIAQFVEKGEKVTSWSESWDMLLPIYEKRPYEFKSLEKLLSQQFAPMVFTVLSSGKVGGVEQRILAVLKRQEEGTPERKKEPEEGDEASRSSQKKSRAFSLYVSKIYWL